MDVYIGFGLLSAGIVVLVFMVLDGWLKSRDAKMAKMSYAPDKTLEEPEFTIPVSHDELTQADEKSGAPLKNSFMQHSLYDDDMPNEKNFSALTPANEIDFTAEQPFTEEKLDMIEQEECFPLAAAVAPQKNKITSNSHEKKELFTPPNLLVLSVMARKDSLFESYDLLQAISATGMQFGEMNIFHYYQSTAVGKVALFSLASANKPGDFDLNNIGDFACNGLMLFLDLGQVPDPQYAFRVMLETAERLAEDLDGSLRADPLTVWSEKVAWQYHQKIMQHKTSSSNKINA